MIDRDTLPRLLTQEPAPRLGAREWESVLSQARRGMLLGRLAHRVLNTWPPDAVPEGPRRHLENALAEVRRQRDVARWESDCIRRALAEVPTPVVLLKGAAYVLADLPPSAGRTFSDIDILVARDQLRPAERALMAAGWVPGLLTPYDERYYRDFMHELPPLHHVERRTVLDVHHTITPPTSRFAVDASLLLADAVPVPAAPGLKVLAPCDMVLHSAVHLLQDGELVAAWRDLLDIDDLLRHFAQQPGFWDRLTRRANELGLRQPLHDVLDQIRRLTGRAVPAGVAAETRSSRGAVREHVFQAMYAEALVVDHPDARGAAAGLAKWAAYVRAHWLRMPWFQILPHLLRKSWMRMTAGRRPERPGAPDVAGASVAMADAEP